jgi:hypothetical protein
MPGQKSIYETFLAETEVGAVILYLGLLQEELKVWTVVLLTEICELCCQ